MSGNPDEVALSGLLDRLTTVDDKIDTTNQILSDMEEIESQQLQALADFISQTTDIDRGEIASQPSEFPFGMSAEVPPNTPRLDPLQRSFDAPYDALITDVLIGFPDGVQQAVGVQMSNGVGTTWIPRGGETSTIAAGSREPEYVTENDTTIKVTLNVEVDEGEPVVAEFISNDPSESHFVTVTPNLRERVPGDGQ